MITSVNSRSIARAAVDDRQRLGGVGRLQRGSSRGSATGAITYVAHQRVVLDDQDGLVAALDDRRSAHRAAGSLPRRSARGR